MEGKKRRQRRKTKKEWLKQQRNTYATNAWMTMERVYIQTTMIGSNALCVKERYVRVASVIDAISKQSSRITQSQVGI